MIGLEVRIMKKNKLTKDELYRRKINEKLGFEAAHYEVFPDIVGSKLSLRGTKYIQPKSGKERTELQHKKKYCCCGGHSIRQYKERRKHPTWKRKVRRKKLRMIKNEEE